MENSDEQLLDSYGQQFLEQFGLPQKRKHESEDDSPNKHARSDSEDEDDGEEWLGIAAAASDTDDDESDKSESETHPSNIIVFEDRNTRSIDKAAEKAQKKMFMSSKVSKINHDALPPSEKLSAEDEEFERQNTQNDALLHRLVHTKLLSGSLNSELDMTPAHRRKAMAGRVMELAGQTKLGKGEKAVRHDERNRASKSVRDGLLDKQRQRQRKKVDDAKAVGNYHPAIKGLLEDSDEKQKAPKRQRGLGMGVGKFRGGILQLSKKDIPGRAPAPPTRGGRGGGGSRGRGRGGGRGKPRGRK